ncbi:MAG: DUF5615 family PIN-like protein [Deltaproteobacteria bacterium]|nr:DUF5615 family PIN-like protein [Deltaproteobacteria bacterium]
MKIFVDENIPSMTVKALQEINHDIIDIRETTHKGLSDEKIWEWVRRDGRMLITTDLGFATHRAEKHNGVLIIRLKKPNRQKIHERVLKAMLRYRAEEWPGMIVVMQDRVQRVWKARI